jgi:flagellin-like hook-associated protein FlgL
MMVVRTNVLALNSHRNLGLVGNSQARASQRLSSGFRINSAADDAAGLAISEGMRAQIRGLNQGSRNAQDGISLIQTAEGYMQTITELSQRIRELIVQASNDTYSDENRQTIHNEISQLTEEINRIWDTATFNGINLFGTPEFDYRPDMGQVGNVVRNLTFSGNNVVGLTLSSLQAAGLTPRDPHEVSDIQDALNVRLGELFTPNFGGWLSGFNPPPPGTPLGYGNLAELMASAAPASQGARDAIHHTLALTMVDMVQAMQPVDAIAMQVAQRWRWSAVSNFVHGHTAQDPLFNEARDLHAHGLQFGIGGDVHSIIQQVNLAITAEVRVREGPGHVHGMGALQSWFNYISGGNQNAWTNAGVGVATNNVMEGLSRVMRSTNPETLAARNRINTVIADAIQGMVVPMNPAPAWTAPQTAAQIGLTAAVLADPATWSNNDFPTPGPGNNIAHGILTLQAHTLWATPLPPGPPQAWDGQQKAGVHLNNALSATGGAILNSGGLEAWINLNSNHSGTVTATNLYEFFNNTASYGAYHGQIVAAITELFDTVISSAGGWWFMQGTGEMPPPPPPILPEDETDAPMDGGMPLFRREWVWLQVGPDSEHAINIDVSDLVENLQMSLDMGSIFGIENLLPGLVTPGHSEWNSIIQNIDSFLGDVSELRSAFGAYQNRLEFTIENADIASENLSAAESRIRDADMALEMMRLTAANVLQQAATAMLAQANQAPQSVLQLLQQ